MTTAQDPKQHRGDCELSGTLWEDHGGLLGALWESSGRLSGRLCGRLLGQGARGRQAEKVGLPPQRNGKVPFSVDFARIFRGWMSICTDFYNSCSAAG